MNRLQKKAWFTLVGFSLNLVIGGAIMAALPTNDPANAKFLGLGVLRIQAYGLCLAAFLVVIVLSDWLFRKKPGDVFDERDRQICQKSTGVATSVFWVVIGVACAVLVLTFGPLRVSFPAVVSPLIVGGLVTFVSAYSVAILLHYGWVGKGAHHE